jgi:hypothetical protein
VQEVRVRYQPKVSLPPQEIHLRWRELVGEARISSQDELEQLLVRLRGCIAPELEQQKIVIID